MKLSDARVPGVATFWRRGTQALAERFQIVGECDASDKFNVLVADLAGDS